ncbi:helix-turn-helix domain-containing protein [Flavobacteriaceae bacterium S356]|uniref:Helix-turn-helix domain-containing protein n=1 Tax=Asprobacillus argus TaxID=3076534 RepID=A0ABU3LGR4_9FLAO|nr:helix-turn-helix domain-containing protein [Flavobacteriaceae bacterium S356]
MTSSFFSLLLIAGAIQGFAFNAFTFLKQKKVSKVILYLNLMVLFLSLNNLQAWLIDNGYRSDFFFIKWLKVPWYMLLFPMFYLFLIHYMQVESRLRKLLRISIFIFSIEMILRVAIMYYTYYFIEGLDSYLIVSYTNAEEIFNAVFGIIIVYKSSFLVFKQKERYQYILSYDDINWIKVFLRLGALIIAFWIMAIVIHNVTGNMSAYVPLRLGTSVLLYWIGYQGFFRYKIVKDRISLRNYISNDRIQSLTIALPRDNTISSKHERDFEKINQYITSEQRFLDAQLTMNILAQELYMSPSHVSKIINNYSDYNFSDYINSYRVEQAKKLLADNDFDSYTMVAIGLECGFNSKSTFYTAFKKLTNLTPTQYRERY